MAEAWSSSENEIKHAAVPKKYLRVIITKYLIRYLNTASNILRVFKYLPLNSCLSIWIVFKCDTGYYSARWFKLTLSRSSSLVSHRSKFKSHVGKTKRKKTFSDVQPLARHSTVGCWTAEPVAATQAASCRNFTNAHASLGRVFTGVFLSIFVWLPRTKSQKPMQLGSSNLTYKCSTMSPGVWRLVYYGSNGKRSRPRGTKYKSMSVFRRNVIMSLAAYISYAGIFPLQCLPHKPC